MYRGVATRPPVPPPSPKPAAARSPSHSSAGAPPSRGPSTLNAAVGGGGGAPAAGAAQPTPLTPVGEANWDAVVMRSTLPVVIDVYADWCAPCKKLSPLLEQAASALAGRVLFVKLNSDVEERIAAQLQIKSLPTLLAVYKGKLLEAPLVGLPTPEALRGFLDRVAAAGGEVDAQTAAAEEYAALMAEGEDLLAMTPSHPQLQPAGYHLFGSAYKAAPGPPEQLGALGGMALVAMRTGDDAAAADCVAKIKGSKNWELGHPLARRAVAALSLNTECHELLKSDTCVGDMKKAVEALAAGNTEVAVDTLLAVVRADRANSAAKALLQRVFAADPKGPASVSGRKRLAAMLFM